MPTYLGDEKQLEELKKEEEKEREFYAKQQERKEAHELEIVREKNKNASERLKIAHRANSRASVWITLFSIIPKTVLIICSFILILAKREVPKGWAEYCSR